jgi:hypothetical protein
MIVCCPECGTSIYCIEAGPPHPVPTVIREPCEYCNGYGYITEHHPNGGSTCPQPYGLSYTCTYCNGTGKGEIKGFIE